ncbi:hypothetical protein HG536_0G00980 [Torulaspora globosa]|uniref:DASH complex subunit ASK1 n=1 Tax=Torulaspora globosa TaxID=48254 RepID=A0A7G3ZL55_9SACH|nr:uncharacterized protein HG536_0G00980 [Torulaspora globosa]QLL34241.1 hypothetical protein HG536_0G00980 [Torulaspora globosa]
MTKSDIAARGQKSRWPAAHATGRKTGQETATTMAEETLEKLDQEITLNLQKIDSNLSYCFNRITKQIIPRVTQYGAVCEEIMDHASWLGSMFQQTGNVELSLQAAGGDSAASPPPSDTLFPLAGREAEQRGPPAAALSDDEDAFHTADVAAAADSSDDDAEGSTLQRQRRKRKVSLLLQQEFGSSSSMVPSPVAIAQRGAAAALRPDSSTTGGYRGMLDSSPVKQQSTDRQQPDESTKQVPKPGTVIHFSTGA